VRVHTHLAFILGFILMLGIGWWAFPLALYEKIDQPVQLVIKRTLERMSEWPVRTAIRSGKMGVSAVFRRWTIAQDVTPSSRVRRPRKKCSLKSTFPRTGKSPGWCIHVNPKTSTSRMFITSSWRKSTVSAATVRTAHRKRCLPTSEIASADTAGISGDSQYQVFARPPGTA